jgi:type II secretory pathway component GspD/PulD (secretin)
VKKVPILGDIPLLGLLFTRKNIGTTSSPTEKTDLLIFVTARIIKDAASQSALAKEEKARPFKLTAREIK